MTGIGILDNPCGCCVRILFHAKSAACDRHFLLMSLESSGETREGILIEFGSRGQSAIPWKLLACVQALEPRCLGNV